MHQPTHSVLMNACYCSPEGVHSLVNEGNTHSVVSDHSTHSVAGTADTLAGLRVLVNAQHVGEAGKFQTCTQTSKNVS